MYNYGARFYDPAIARFTTVDPLADLYSFQTPYEYAANNPISFIVFMGMGPEYFKNKHTEKRQLLEKKLVLAQDGFRNKWQNKSVNFTNPEFGQYLSDITKVSKIYNKLQAEIKDEKIVSQALAEFENTNKELYDEWNDMEDQVIEVSAVDKIYRPIEQANGLVELQETEESVSRRPGDFNNIWIKLKKTISAVSNGANIVHALGHVNAESKNPNISSKDSEDAAVNYEKDNYFKRRNNGN